MSADVRGFYAALGVELPNHPGPWVPVRCFIDPGAHKHGDRDRSAGVSLDHGGFTCHACGASGNHYQAALACGRSEAEAMELLERLGFHLNGQQPSRRQQPKRAQAKPTPRLDEMVLAWMWSQKRWTREAVDRLQVGFDGERITFGDTGVRYEAAHGHGAPGPKTKTDAGTKRGLWPAPDSIEGDQRWLVEGEPDAVTGHSAGLPCVAVPGTNGWKAEYAEAFRGRHVTICMDADLSGRRASKRIAADLVGVAASVRILDLAPEREDGFDLSDALAEDVDAPAELVQAGALLMAAAAAVAPLQHLCRMVRWSSSRTLSSRARSNGCGLVASRKTQ